MISGSSSEIVPKLRYTITISLRYTLELLLPMVVVRIRIWIHGQCSVLELSHMEMTSLHGQRELPQEQPSVIHTQQPRL